jgi:hypothetical protein
MRLLHVIHGVASVGVYRRCSGLGSYVKTQAVSVMLFGSPELAEGLHRTMLLSSFEASSRCLILVLSLILSITFSQLAQSRTCTSSLLANGSTYGAMIAVFDFAVRQSARGSNFSERVHSNFEVRGRR